MKVATSREPLRAEGETEWRVPSLSLLPRQHGVELFETTDAVQLFVERAAQVKPGFRLTHQNAVAIVTICRELDGSPLALRHWQRRRSERKACQQEVRLGSPAAVRLQGA